MPVPTDQLHGTLDALVLKTLTFGPRHGYGILLWLRQQTQNGVPIEEGSLYPALYRMERDGWIEADWGVSELGRKAKVYSITRKGRTQLRAKTEQFASFVQLVAPLLLPG